MKNKNKIIICLLAFYLLTGCISNDLSDFNGNWQATHFITESDVIIDNYVTTHPFKTNPLSRLKTTISDKEESISIRVNDNLWYDFKVIEFNKKEIKLKSLNSDKLSGIYKVRIEEEISKPFGFNNEVKSQILELKNEFNYVVLVRFVSVQPQVNL